MMSVKWSIERIRAFRQFYDAMEDKFFLRAEGRDLTQPVWDECNTAAMMKKLKDEINEFDEAVQSSTPSGSAGSWMLPVEAIDELVDIANYCMFLWLRYNMVER
jgi:hypothetical protein